MTGYCRTNHVEPVTAAVVIEVRQPRGFVVCRQIVDDIPAVASDLALDSRTELRALLDLQQASSAEKLQVY